MDGWRDKFELRLISFKPIKSIRLCENNLIRQILRIVLRNCTVFTILSFVLSGSRVGART
jgi:hypothetical protein